MKGVFGLQVVDLFLRTLTSKDGVAMGEATKAPDEVPVMASPFQAVVQTRLFVKVDGRFLILRRFAVHQW